MRGITPHERYLKFEFDRAMEEETLQNLHQILAFKTYFKNYLEKCKIPPSILEWLNFV